MVDLDTYVKKYLSHDVFYRLAFITRALFGNIYTPNERVHFVQDFRNFFYTHSQTVLDEKLSRLKQGLDSSSKQVIDLVWRRYCKQLSVPELSDQLLLSKNLFTHEEWRERKEVFKAMKQVYEEYRLDESPECSIFYYNFGLRYLSNKHNEMIEDSICLDIGAYNGDSILKMDELNPAKIIAYEPLSENVKRMESILQKNEIESNVEVHRKAVGKSQGFVAIEGSGDSASIDRSGEDVECVKLDEENIQNVGLIKLDVEGSERDVLEGALNLIKASRPILTISIYHSPQQFLNIKPWLESHLEDYRFMVRKLDPFSLVYETTLIGFPENG